MKVVFFGTGEIALPTFRAAIASEDCEVLALVTQPDKAVGRSGKLRPPAIKTIALEAGISVLQPEKVRAPDALAELAALKADVYVVMAYGQILPQELIDQPNEAIINLHASLLPRYRGASCIQAAIDEGDSITGWTVMHVVKALDAGDMIANLEVAIELEDTAASLHDRLAELAPEIFLKAFGQLQRNEASRTPQNDEASTYVPKLEREAGLLDWSWSAERLARRIRAYFSWPGTYSHFTDSKGREKRLKIFPIVDVLEAASSQAPGTVVATEGSKLVIACGEGQLQLNEVQADGGKRISATDFQRGNQVTRLF